ncbi:hypothetical protein DNK77_27070 [Enterobacter cloacae complex sp.]|nr:hypothetical protein DNK77_27070 [Enterobacter cloacae complex sp.]
MGSCAAPSAKGDDKFITTDYLQQCRMSSAHCSKCSSVPSAATGASTSIQSATAVAFVCRRSNP